MTVRLHPEITADPLTLRWVTDATVDSLPDLQVLLDDGTLAHVEVGRGEIHTRLTPDRSWADDGGRVRSTLFQALSQAAEKQAAETGQGPLWRRVSEVLNREVAPFVDSHGGRIDIVSLADGVLTVSLGGTCGHCTLRGTTLRTLVASTVQPRFPEIRQVRAARD